MFRCLLHHLHEDQCFTCSKTICFLLCCYTGRAIKCKIYPCFEVCNAVTTFKPIFISSFCTLKIFKMLVKTLHCSTLISVGSCFLWGTAVAQWLRCCATNRKVAGSIPAGVSGFFIDITSFRSHYGPQPHPLTEISTRSISWG